MRKTIAIDCDSVLFPINELVVLPLLSSRLGREVRKIEITDWDYGEIDGAKEIAYEAFAREDLYDGYQPGVIAPDAMDVLADLRYRHRVLAVSSPVATHAGSKWEYLRRCGFKHEDIVLCGDKSLVEFDVLLDDAPKYLLDVGAAHAVVFDQPWNRGIDLRDFERAYGWEDVPRKLERLI
jgi:5'(3')-deoxyribonucleotidase